MLKMRVIPCLDVKDGRVVKGVNFVDLVDAGDPVEQAKIYDREGADELLQERLKRGDHAFLAGHDETDRTGAEESRSNRFELRDELVELAIATLSAESGQAAHRMKHADALQAVVDRALRGEL